MPAPVAKVGRARTIWRYLRDPRAPKLGKLLLVVAMAYVVIPTDLIPDVPIIGWLDDIGVMGLALMYANRVASRYQARLHESGEAPVPPLEPSSAPT